MKQIKCYIAIIIVLGIILSGCIEEQPQQQQPVKTIEELAIDIVTLLMKNNFSGVYSFFDSSISSQITAEEFASIWEQQVIPSHGTIIGIVKTRVSNESGFSVVYVTCNFSEVDILDVKILFNSERKVVSLLVVPVQEEFQYTPPSYVDLSLFTEEEVVIGSGEWMLPGTLTVPNGNGPFPAVVLVHGSGPNDRDETYGPNKPFKDIAWGLASQGIVVLRYEKRTKQYPNESAAIENFTVEDETIDDALAGVDLLNNSEDMNHSDIFVLGHSLGGMLAPQIALQDDRIDGLIILAGPTRPLEDLMLEQTQYLANLSGINQSNQIESIKDMVEKIKNLDINESELVLGAPKSYWIYLSTYDPVVTAQSLHIPMLILQGKRDYQVTMIDFARWNNTFSKRASVTLLTYQLLNHFFIAGTGVPNNSEYLIEGHVAEEVILDIGVWIKNI
jgi:dienelactone hydrolase